jgi:hypothetical protein
LIEKWFMLLLLYFLPLLFKVWQRSGSCCCYIVYHYCLRFHIWVVQVVVVILSTITVLGLTKESFVLWLLYCLPLMLNVLPRNGLYCRGGYSVYHYYLMFYRGVAHVLVDYIFYHCCLRFDRWEIRIVVVGFTV